MCAPVYPTAMDLVVFAPNRRGAACCIGWLDLVNLVGLFEPVATQPVSANTAWAKPSRWNDCGE